MQRIEVTTKGSWTVNARENARVELCAAGATVAVVVPVAELQAIEATLSILATTGAQAAIDEGLADLRAKRLVGVRELLLEWGIGPADGEAPDEDKGEGTSTATVAVSHRARWDLELIPPAAAQECLTMLASWAPPIAGGAQLAPPLVELSVFGGPGYRLICRNEGAAEPIAVVHIDGWPTD